MTHTYSRKIQTTDKDSNPHSCTTSMVGLQKTNKQTNKQTHKNTKNTITYAEISPKIVKARELGKQYQKKKKKKRKKKKRKKKEEEEEREKKKKKKKKEEEEEEEEEKKKKKKQSNHWSVNFEVTVTTRPGNISQSRRTP